MSGGIRLQSRRGGTRWWSRRWLAAFEASAVGERLAQGLRDARQGQVIELDLELGAVRVRVQGTRREPHAARIDLPVLEQEAWLRIARAIASRGSSRAALLAGQLPDDIEAVFRGEGLPLFPVLEDDATGSCTCDDWSSPCRHVLAGCFLVSELLDSEPLQAFKMRGIEPSLLHALVAGVAPARAAENDLGPAVEQQPVALDPYTFWAGGAYGGINATPPTIDAPLVRILGAPARWRGADSFEPAMRRLYARVASDPRSTDVALGRGS